MNKAVLTIAFLLFYGLVGFGQTNIGQVVATSNQKISGGKVTEAIDDLINVLKDSSTHVGALNALAFAYRASKDYVKSVEIYKKAYDVQPNNIRGQFTLGVAHALAGNINEAFEMLIEVKESNQFNITNIGLSPAAAILKNDPRYQSLFPTKSEYAMPFIEDGITIIHDWYGENNNDQFGWIGRNIGDVNGDGIMDLTSSAPTNSEVAEQAGKIYVYSGKEGALIWSYASKDPSGQLGMSIEAAGDVNADGIPDVVAGAPYVNKTMVFSGKDGTVLYEWQGKDSKGAFGRGVKGVGDVNKDGHGDVLVGEPYQIWGGPINSSKIEGAGNVYLYSGKDGTVLKKWTGDKVGDGFGTALAGKTVKGHSLLMIGVPNARPNKGGEVQIFKGMEDSPFFTIKADSTGSQLGSMFMSVVGDVNGDGTMDVYASDFSNTALGNATGRAYIHSGATGEHLFTFTGETAGDGFGIGVADAGDINKDGNDDLVIGAWQHASAAPSGGKIYVYSGKDGNLIRTLTGSVVGETLGFDTTGIGDVNGDGVVDLLLTSAWSAINGVRSGRMMIVSGK